MEDLSGSLGGAVHAETQQDTKLLAMARKRFDGAEVWVHERAVDRVSYANERLSDVESQVLTSIAVRVFRGGRVGWAYTRDPERRAGLLDDAAVSLAGGAPAAFELPSTPPLPDLGADDPSIAQLTAGTMADELLRVAGRLSATGGDVVAHSTAGREVLRVYNTAGADLLARNSRYALEASAIFPGSAEGIERRHVGRSFSPVPEATLEEAVALYRAHARDAKPSSRRMQVLFQPNSLMALVWRLQSGTSAHSVHQGISPVAQRVGERVVSEHITFAEDPRSPQHPLARTFDDEGVPCERLPIVERGVLQGFFTDLDHAARLGIPPNGCGFRWSPWGSEPMSLRPTPAIPYAVIEPGQDSFEQLVARMDHGIILEGALGAHSGNIPNGDYAIGVSPGLYVERGEIVGRVRDVMLSGNAWQTLQEVVALGRDVQNCWAGRMPAILCDGVSVSARV